MNDDARFMQMALALAKKGRGFTSPNPMVGAVVVRNGQVVGKGWHEAVGRAHAEVNAIDDAGPDATGAVLYVTLEPCNHTGRTGPCTQKILQAGIRKVVVAMKDPNPDVAGGGNAVLAQSGVEVQTGVCEAEAQRLNEGFIKYVRFRRPFVVLKCATTLDGRMATRTGDARWVTGAASREQVHRMRHAADAIMVGIGTVRADDPQLTTRLEGGQSRDPARLVLDSRLSMTPEARMLHQSSSAPTIVVCGPDAPEQNKARLEAQGARVVRVPLRDDRVDLQALMARLGEMQISHLLIEGGARVCYQALADGIVDKAVFFIAPKILGGNDGVPVCHGPGPELMRDCIRLRDVRTAQWGDDLMMEGYVVYPSEEEATPPASKA